MKYDKNLQEITLELNKFKKAMLQLKCQLKLVLNMVRMNTKLKKLTKELSKLYKIKTDKEPSDIIVDPNMWVLKNYTLKKIKSS